jgi:hypothetical protein
MAQIIPFSNPEISNTYIAKSQSLIKLINIESKSGEKWEILEIII